MPELSDSDPRIAPISVATVRQLFARSARCANSQFLRREIASRMFERLQLIRARPQRVLDAGCGEGDDLLGLQQAFPDAQLLGIDASLPMLQSAARAGEQSRSGMQKLVARFLGGRPAGVHAAQLACADFGALPLPRSSIDLLWSNLALHWHPRPHQVIGEWARVMQVDGLLMFSCFGPDTFAELRAAFDAVEPGRAAPDAVQRVLPFVDLHDYGDMLVQAGFATPVMDMERLNITYSSAEKLLDDVRAFGGNPSVQRMRGLQGRRQWARFLQALNETRDASGQWRLTVEVIYGHAFRAVPKMNSHGEAIVRFERNRRK